MKCEICGHESEFEAGFIKQRRSFRSSRRTLCPKCWVRRRNAFQGWYQIAVIVGGIVGYVLLWQNPWSTAGRYFTTLFLIDLFLILSVVPHELGHALAGRLVGWRVFAVVIGVGKQVFKFRLFGIVFSFHLLPVAGITRAMPLDVRWFRFKRFVYIFAGPAVNAAIVMVIFLLWREEWREFGLFGLPEPARLCLWANLWVVVVNLWPHQSKTLNLGTDGKQLLKLFSRKQADLEELQATRFTLEAMLRRDEHRDFEGALDWVNKGLALYPTNHHLLNMSGLLSLDKQDYCRAREIFVRLLPGESKPGLRRYTVLNNIAYVDALIGDPALLPEADAYSKEAYTCTPWVASIAGTRGTVLVAMGQFEPGIKLLKESFEKALSALSKAENACHLTIAYVRSGNRDEACKYLNLARQLESGCRLIGRAEKEFSDAMAEKNRNAFS